MKNGFQIRDDISEMLQAVIGDLSTEIASYIIRIRREALIAGRYRTALRSDAKKEVNRIAKRHTPVFKANPQLRLSRHILRNRNKRAGSIQGSNQLVSQTNRNRTGKAQHKKVSVRASRNKRSVVRGRNNHNSHKRGKSS